MALEDFSIFAAIRHKMKWHQTRQTMLAQNVANADTPKYRAHDLVPVDFSRALPTGVSGVAAERTHMAHIEGVSASRLGDFTAERTGGFEITPEGNEVVLEEQMMKVTSNQMDFQLASTLYNKSLSLLKTAAGRRG